MTAAAVADAARAAVEAVEDPELPHVTIGDLGIVRSVAVAGHLAEIVLTPTYLGCPAIDQIRDDVEAAVHDLGLRPEVRFVLDPPWTTDWITEAGRSKLLEYGIAPPAGSAGKRELLGKPAIRCPRCGTDQTTVISEFGSTACKASYKCNECLEPFEYFKCI